MGIIGNPTLCHYYRWTWLQRVMLSSHLLPHFYSYSHCKGHVKQMIKRRVPNTFVTDDVEACKFFSYSFKSPTPIFQPRWFMKWQPWLALMAHKKFPDSYSYGIVWIYGWQQERPSEQALFKPNQTRPALRSITMNEVSVLGISLSTQKVGV